MFARVLIDSPVILMTMEWFGLGALRVTDRRTGHFSQASPEVRNHFLQTLEEMKRLGVKLDPSDSRATKAFLHYGTIVVSPDSLGSRTSLSHPPARVAAMLAESER